HQTRSKNVTIKTVASAEHLSAFTDPDALKLILQNLISNAIKYSADHTEIIVEISRSDHELLVRVSDQGIGIPAHQKEHIFEKLFRADNARATDADGNGLGLYIAKIASEAMKGTLTFESEEGKNTVFTFR